MGCNNAKPINKQALIRVKRNLSTKNLEKDIRTKEKLITENERVIKLLNRELNKQESNTVDCGVYRRLLSAKQQLEDENIEQSMRIDVLHQHRTTSLSAQYLNETFSMKSKSTDDR